MLVVFRNVFRVCTFLRLAVERCCNGVNKSRVSRSGRSAEGISDRVIERIGKIHRSSNRGPFNSNVYIYVLEYNLSSPELQNRNMQLTSICLFKTNAFRTVYPDFLAYYRSLTTYIRYYEDSQGAITSENFQ